MLDLIVLIPDVAFDFTQKPFENTEKSIWASYQYLRLQSSSNLH